MESQTRIRVAAFITNPDNHLLMVQHKKNDKTYWLLPGGGVDYGETLPQALRRELLEELQLPIDVQEFLYCSESLAPDKSRHILHMIFRCQSHQGALPKLGSDPRIVDYAFIPPSQLEGLILHPPHNHEIFQLLNQQSFPDKYLGNRWI